ncbi:hypothetical protein [Acidovorax sp. M2(2025)]|uniref:hypothetical protein n=1 Tax=Acidovorax sp. M2(2025) TaxID=3411355 RepID=UPI003BF51E44
MHLLRPSLPRSAVRRSTPLAVSQILLALCAGAAATSAAAATVFDNLGLADSGFYSAVDFGQHLGVRIAAGAPAVSVTGLTLLLNDAGSTGGLVVRVCDDGAGGSAPGASCTTFAPLDPVPTAGLGPVRFTGTHPAPAGGHVWVVAHGTVPNLGPGSPGSNYRWAWAGGPGTTYGSTDGGATWALEPGTVLLSVTGAPTGAPAAVGIPALGGAGLAVLSLVLGAAGARASRRRVLRGGRQTS